MLSPPSQALESKKASIIVLLPHCIKLSSLFLDQCWRRGHDLFKWGPGTMRLSEQSVLLTWLEGKYEISDRFVESKDKFHFDPLSLPHSAGTTVGWTPFRWVSFPQTPLSEENSFCFPKISFSEPLITESTARLLMHSVSAFSGLTVHWAELGGPVLHF